MLEGTVLYIFRYDLLEEFQSLQMDKINLIHLKQKIRRQTHKYDEIIFIDNNNNRQTLKQRQ